MKELISFMELEAGGLYRLAGISMHMSGVEWSLHQNPASFELQEDELDASMVFLVVGFDENVADVKEGRYHRLLVLSPFGIRYMFCYASSELCNDPVFEKVVS